MNRKRLRNSILVLIATGAVVGAALGGWYWYRSTLPTPPAVKAAELDGDVADAIERARRAVLADLRSADKWGELGLVLFAHGMYPDALPCFVRAEALQASDARWPYYQALIAINDDTEKSLAPLERAIRNSGRTVAPRLRRAETLLTLERIDDAETAYREVLLVEPNNARAILGLGLIASRRSQWEESTRLLQALVNDPTCRRAARSALVDVNARRGDATSAEIHRRAAASLPEDVSWPDPYLIAMEERQFSLTLRLRRADRLISRQQYSEATSLLRQIIHSHPQCDEAHYHLGRIFIATGDPASAEEALQNALRIAPDSVQAHFLLGAARFMRSNVPGAEESFRKVVMLKTDDAPAHFNIGICRSRQNDANGALLAYRTAIRFRPDFIEPYVAAGELLLQRGDKQAARTLLEDAVRLQPENDKARSLLKKAQEP